MGERLGMRRYLSKMRVDLDTEGFVVSGKVKPVARCGLRVGFEDGSRDVAGEGAAKVAELRIYREKGLFRPMQGRDRDPVSAATPNSAIIS